MKHMSPREAHEFLENTPDAVLIDCRSETEFLFVGHPVGAVHVAWQESPDWAINPNFVQQVRAEAGESQPVVIICRSGNRSADAGLALESAGFTQVYNVREGFEGDRDENFRRGTVGGWRYYGLPWEQT